MNDLQVFNFKDQPVRTVLIDEEPWFVAKDVADILEIRDPYAATRGLDNDEKLLHTLHVSGQKRETTLINESGLYNLILRSNKPEARAFRKWITSQVLPSIRKTGHYELSEDALILKTVNLLRDRVRIQAEKIEADRPKVEFYEQVATSNGAIPIGEAAKSLKLGIGRNKLFEFLKKQKILMYRNLPYQKYIDSGYFRVVLKTFTMSGVEQAQTYTQTLVYPKGLDFIRQLYLKTQET